MSSSEVYEFEQPVDALDAAHEMEDWFEDFAFGFSDEIGKLPEVTRGRLTRQFGNGDIASQLTKLRDILFVADEELQPALALYICGYPDEAIDVLSDQGTEGIELFLEKTKQPFRLPSEWLQPIVLSVESPRPIVRSVQDPRTMVPEVNLRVSQTQGKDVETSASPSHQTTSQSTAAQVAPTPPPEKTVSGHKHPAEFNTKGVQNVRKFLDADPGVVYGDPESYDVDENPLAWQERALCAQTDPEAFFPEKGGSTREAKKVCLSCDVSSECLDYALKNDERFGIWGGLSERERRKLKRRAI